MLRVNVGSGQRPFGHPRPIPQHNQGCAFCNLPFDHHGAEDPSFSGTFVPSWGHQYIPSGPDAWINVDCNSKWNPDIVADGAHMPMFADGSADMVVLHHVLEHAGCGEGAPVIDECCRILAPGGSFLVFVPDMRALAEGWLQIRISTQIFMTNTFGAFMDSDADRHRWGYDAASLREFLTAYGFLVKPFNWRVIPGADIARDWWILAAEAVK